MAKSEDNEVKTPSKVTDITSAEENIELAVEAFCEKWISLPEMIMPCEIMDQSQLRDAMGLYATIDLGDPWPQAERALLQEGFRWHNLGGSRVMFLRERDDCIGGEGWESAEELENEEQEWTPKLLPMNAI
ncbi:MAG: hypothetical protein IJR86_07565 [Bacteroidaceae bacterium]|nr:hypothetical protein [Bacteroidaceae bacterium]